MFVRVYMLNMSWVFVFLMLNFEFFCLFEKVFIVKYVIVVGVEGLVIFFFWLIWSFWNFYKIVI